MVLPHQADPGAGAPSGTRENSIMIKVRNTLCAAALVCSVAGVFSTAALAGFNPTPADKVRLHERCDEPVQLRDSEHGPHRCVPDREKGPAEPGLPRAFREEVIGAQPQHKRRALPHTADTCPVSAVSFCKSLRAGEGAAPPGSPPTSPADSQARNFCALAFAGARTAAMHG